MSKLNKVAIIGSNSFSGSHFIDILLEKRDYEIIGISRSPEKHEIYLPYKKRELSRFGFYQLDLNKDTREILNLLDKEKPKYIVNFASQSIVEASWKYPADWYRTNVLSLVELVDALKNKGYLEKFVHISTPEVYGHCTGQVDETAAFNPSTPYAASRAAADVFLQLMAKQFDFPVVFTRAANVYGAGQQLFKIIPKVVVSIKKGKKIPLHGGGEVRRSFIHIRDVCYATLSIMERAKPREIYHLSTPDLISVRDLVKCICDKLYVDFNKSTQDVSVRRGSDAAYILDSSKAEQEFGWKSNIQLKEGLDEIIKWIEENWNIIQNEQLEYIHQS